MQQRLEINRREESIALSVETSCAFPKTDFNYRAAKLDNIKSRCVACREPSFRAISRDYFANEEPQHFAREAVLFFMMMMTVAWPLLDASTAVLDLLQI
jgi:hypothetical protein